MRGEKRETNKKGQKEATDYGFSFPPIPLLIPFSKLGIVSFRAALLLGEESIHITFDNWTSPKVGPLAEPIQKGPTLKRNGGSKRFLGGGFFVTLCRR